MFNRFATFYLILSLFIFIFVISPNKIFAQENESPSSPSAIISYDLPYPGILPDSPFYKLKLLRDKIMVQLINSPEEKIRFYLRLADKGILASAILVDKHNISLAQSTALKAENYVTILSRELYASPLEPSKELINTIKTASLKHQEVLTSLLPRVSEEEKKTFETVIDFSKRNLQTIQDYQYGRN